MKNAMQLKALVKNLAVKKGVAPQALQQNYMLERILERISVSSYRDKFIIKGGMLIAAIVGLNNRTTMDMDATLHCMPLTENSVREALSEILSIDLNDSITFTINKISLIREDDTYGGYRASLIADFDTLNIPLKIDLTTGDKITPREITFRYPLMLEDRNLEILSYNLETILAEKYETIIRRSTLNTRMRDFYDIYILMTLHESNIDFSLLKKAIGATSELRNSVEILKGANRIISSLNEHSGMQALWELYQKDFSYAKGISWADIIGAIKTLYERIL